MKMQKKFPNLSFDVFQFSPNVKKRIKHKLARISASLFIGVSLLFLTMQSSISQDKNAERKVFYNSIVEPPNYVSRASSSIAISGVESANKKKLLTLRFGVQIKNAEELKERVANGEVLSSKELNTGYAGDVVANKRLVEWLKAEKFTIESMTPDHSAIYATASVGQIENSLQTKMETVFSGGVAYPAAQTPPSLPADIGAKVTGIEGLQPYLKANKHILKISQGPTTFAASPEHKKMKNLPPYFPKEILSAYGHSDFSLTGKGQTIGILIDTLPNKNDLEKFWKESGSHGNLANVKLINVQNVQLPDVEGEESLDVQWASGIAPGAQIRVYAAGSLSWVDLNRALDMMLSDFEKNPSMRQISISLGLGETYMSLNEIEQQTNRFLRMAALGINVFVSTGDAGSHPDATGHTRSGPLQVEYQASDPFVVAVGGTTIQLDSVTGAKKDELAWEGSGGGISGRFDIPKWQSGFNIAGNTKRMIPDVSSPADPATGAFVILKGRMQQIGGTSWSAPTWAGISALANEGRTRKGKSRLGYLNPIIYSLERTKAFQDINSGSNGPQGIYDAHPSYNLVTGLGVPKLELLLEQLVNH